MNKKQFLLVGSILVFAIIAAIAFSWTSTRNGVPGNTATNTLATTTSQPSNGSSTPRISRSYEYGVNLPNALMLVDSLGRRTGKDPVSGTFYHEIPGTAYSEESHSGQLFVSEVPLGSYSLYVLGGETGSYWIDAYPPQKVTGTIQTNAMVAYTLNYGPGLENPPLVFQAAVSSTLNITSAPPDNLPPPPVPGQK